MFVNGLISVDSASGLVRSQMPPLMEHSAGAHPKCVAVPSEMLFVLLMLADLSRCGALMPAAPPPPGGLWDWTGRGDFRAVVTVSARVLQQAAGGPIAAVVEWRRRDAEPEQKAIIVTDSAGHVLANVSTPKIEQHAGVIVFTPAAAGTYYVYYMPYTQSGIGGAHQKWIASAAGGGGDWQPAGNFSGKAAVHTRQDFVLPEPVTSKAFRWTCLRSWGSNPAWQAFVVELNFRTPTTGWLPNKATDTDPSPVTGASGWQPDVGPPPSGHPWQAMDGDITTIWDPQGSPSWLSVEFDEPVTIDAIGVLGYGDTTHDIHLHKLEYQPLTNGTKPQEPWQHLPAATSVRIESRDAFHNVDPMGLPANATEVASLVKRFPADVSQRGYLLFPEPREHKVMMDDRVPYSWVQRGPSDHFAANVTRGEWFYFQIALFAVKELSTVTITPFELTGGATTLRTQCLNTEGSTSLGEDVSASSRPQTPGFASFLVNDVAASSVKALWIGLQVPDSLEPGTVLHGTATLSTVLADVAGSSELSLSSSQTVTATLTVSQEPVSVTHGFDDLQSYARLAWLNSKLAIDDEVVKPFIPLQVDGGKTTEQTAGVFDPHAGSANKDSSLKISLLNRHVQVAANGLPSAVTVTRPASAHGVIASRDISLLAKPVALDFISDEASHGGRSLPLTVTKPASVWQRSPASVGWSSEFVAGPARVFLNGTIHMDGYIDFVFELSSASSASSSFVLRDIRLEIEWLPQPKERMMLAGMGVVTGALQRNTTVAWKWSLAHKNNFMWAGTASAGLKLQLKDDNDLYRDAAEKSYSSLPLTWDNHGRGGANITALSQANDPQGGDTVAPEDLGARIVAYTGQYTLSPKVQPPSTNGSRVFRFDLSVTPFKPRNESQHWALRHFQVGYPSSAFTSAEDVAKTGATVVNIHQGVDTMINPFINYPFIPESVALLANYTRAANGLGMRVKFYYTVRELSNHCAEIWALRQLGDEVYRRPACGGTAPGEPGCGGAAWLQEQLVTSYAPAWFDQLEKPNGADAAIAQAGLAGRWLNYYVEGLRESIEHSPHINGIYYDGILFDRFTMVRVRKVLERYSQATNGLEGLIDMHTGNDYAYAGQKVTDAVAYANHWAYVDSLWIGEMFSYDSEPYNWLFEISGLAHGVFSDMLGTPNPYRGMLFGSTGRFGCANPTPMWSYWDQIEINATDMIGWWEPESPVQQISARQDVKATCYVNLGKNTLVAVASWASENVTISLSNVGWSTLGLAAGAVKTVAAHAIPSFQPARTWQIGEPIQVEPGKGWLLMLEP